MKKKLSIGIAVVVIIVVGFIGFCMWFLSGTGSTYYLVEVWITHTLYFLTMRMEKEKTLHSEHQRN